MAAALVLAALLLFELPVNAQATGTITGTVSDPSGAVVPNAKLTLKNELSGDVRSTTSNGVGYFAFASVAPGTYTVRAEFTGFKAWEYPNLPVRPGDKRDLDVRLEVGATATEVTVSALAGEITPVASGERSAVLSSVDIQRLSLIGRDVTELVRTLPGVAVFNGGDVANRSAYDPTLASYGNQGSAVGTGFTINGSAYRGGADLTSDGAHIIDIGCNCGTDKLLNQEMTAEVKVQTSNFSADSAKGPVVVNVIGKSGGGDYHGSVYLHARDSVLNAQDYDLGKRGIAKPPDKYFYPGGNFGGAVPHTNKKLLFWTGFEYYGQYQFYNPNNLSTAWVPTLSMRNGDFSATAADNIAFGTYNQASGACGSFSMSPWQPWCHPLTSGENRDAQGRLIPATGIIPADGFDPGGVAILKMIPLPNTDPSKDPLGHNYVNLFLPDQNGWVYHARVDYNFTESTKLYGTYDLQRMTEQAPIHLWWWPYGSIPYPGGQSTRDASETYTGHFVHVFSASLTNEMSAAYSFINFPLAPNDPSAATRSGLGYPYKGYFRNGDPMMPSITNEYWTGIPMMDQGNIFFANNGKSFQWQKGAFTFQDDLTKVFRTHTFKVGFFAERTLNSQAQMSHTNGYIDFMTWWAPACDGGGGIRVGTLNPMANLLVGCASNGYSEDQFQPVFNMGFHSYAGYFMDTWKVVKRLTLDLGVRVDRIGNWMDYGYKSQPVQGVAIWVPGDYAGDVAAGVSVPGLRWMGRDPVVPNSGAPQPITFSPRLGLAWDLFGTGKTVLRGGYGIYHWQTQWNDVNQSPNGGAIATAIGSKLYSTGGKTLAYIDALGLAAAGNPQLAGGFVPAGAIDPLHFKLPVTYSYNFTISRQMPWNSLLELGYVGNNTENMPLQGQGPGGGNINQAGDVGEAQLNINYAPIGALFTTCPRVPASVGTCWNQWEIQGSSFPWANYTTLGAGYGGNLLDVMKRIGWANYNSLQVSWTRQRGRLVYNLNYAWSKALGIWSTGQYGGHSVDNLDLKNNYGVMNTDRSHVFNASYSFDLGSPYKGNPILQQFANGWTISGITTWQSGFNIQAAWDPRFGFGGSNGLATSDPGYVNLDASTWYGTNFVHLMPVLTCDPRKNLKPNQYINGACFGVPAPGTQGQNMFPYIKGPAFWNSDLSVYKNFKVREKQNIQFRASAFNFLNHPLPSLASANGGFGPGLNFVCGDPTKCQTSDPFANAAGPWVVSNASTFGYAQTKLGRRVMELSVKYTF